MPTIATVRTVQEQVVDNLRRLILEGEFAPGDKLPQEELAVLLGVSAMPVREGLRRLQAEGLVEFVPRRGAFVASFSAQACDELFHIREALETLAFRWALERIEAAQIERLRALLARIEEAEAHLEARQRAALVRDFLWTIVESAGRPHLIAAIRRYYNMTYLYQRQYSAAFALSKRRIDIYRRMLQAIAAHDVEAAIAAHRENYALVRATMAEMLKEE